MISYDLDLILIKHSDVYVHISGLYYKGINYTFFIDRKLNWSKTNGHHSNDQNVLFLNIFFLS